jgi:hypothetical protein
VATIDRRAGHWEVGELSPVKRKRPGRHVGKVVIILAETKSLTDLKGRQAALVVRLRSSKEVAVEGQGP